MLPALLLPLLLLSPAHDGHAGEKHPARHDPARFLTSRASPIRLPLPEEKDAFFFVVFGDRTGGPREGVKVLAEAVEDVNLLEPDLVMTVGDLVQGYNETPVWLEEMREFKGIMERLKCPWFPVAGNHDIYWRGQGAKPPGEHEADFEQHFGPLWYAFRHKSAWFISLYSDEGDPATGVKAIDRPESQRMSPEQLAWLSATLAKVKESEHVFVFLHHPRWLTDRYGDDWENVHRVLAAAGNVTAVFAGHIHRMRYDGVRDGIEYFALATVGGVQEGYAAEAGYLHQYHIVTVRKEGIAVAAYPVGAAMDPRAITGEISEEIETLTKQLAPEWSASVVFAADQSAEAELALSVRNPTRRPIEVTATPDSQDSRWRFAPDHEHVTLQPGESRALRLMLARPAGAFDAAFRVPELLLQVDYLGDGLRVPLPVRRLEIPLDAAQLAAPRTNGQDLALALDGVDDCLAVESARLALPEGPFTIEGWLCAEAFPERAGFLNKTESSEFGLFVGGGKPEFMVHLGGKYRQTGASGAALERGRWHHLAGVYDGAQVRLYVDGRLAGAGPAPGARKANDLPFLIGADVAKDGRGASFVPGAMDEVRVSKVARYAGQEFTPARRFEPDADTLLLLHMDAPFGPWMADSSGRGVHATQRGAPALVPAR